MFGMIPAGAALAVGPFSGLAPITLEGAVKAPGSVYVAGARSLSATIQEAGGFLSDADRRKIEVVAADGTVRRVDLTRLGTIPAVHPGERVRVSRVDPSAHVFLDGAVLDRGPMPYSEGLTLAQALQAAGPSPSSEVNRVTVSRTSPDGKTEVEVHSLYALATGSAVLRPGDRVTVPYAQGRNMSDRDLITILIVALALIALSR